MRIVDRYVVRELIGPFLMGVSAFLVMLVGDILYTLADYLATQRVPIPILVRLIVLKIPAILVLTLPVSTLVGVLLGLGRLAKDQEIFAMRTAGLSLTRIFLPAVGFAVFATGLTFATNEMVAPWANHRADTIIRQMIYRQVLPPIEEHVFLRGPQNRIFYINHVDRERRILRGVMVYELAGRYPRLITAQEATWDDQTWNLSDGTAYYLTDDGKVRAEVTFSTLQLAVGLGDAGIFDAERTPQEMSIRELRTHLQMLGRGGVDARQVAVDYYFKFALPLACVVFALIGAPLSLLSARSGRFLGVAVAIVLVFGYYVIMSTARALGKTGVLDPALAAWLPNLVFGVLGTLLILYLEGWPRRRLPAALEMHA